MSSHWRAFWRGFLDGFTCWMLPLSRAQRSRETLSFEGVNTMNFDLRDLLTIATIIIATAVVVVITIYAGTP